jgi:hypothetical protein
VILLDSDVLLIDQRYRTDARYSANRQAIEHAQKIPIALGMTAQALLEVVGILSFNVSPTAVAALPLMLTSLYGLTVRPDFTTHPDYADCAVAELLTQMAAALGDAVQAVQIAHHAMGAQCLLTWNARHFQGKITIPVLTPEEWLKQQGVTP